MGSLWDGNKRFGLGLNLVQRQIWLQHRVRQTDKTRYGNRKRQEEKRASFTSCGLEDFRQKGEKIAYPVKPWWLSNQLGQERSRFILLNLTTGPLRKYSNTFDSAWFNTIDTMGSTNIKMVNLPNDITGADEVNELTCLADQAWHMMVDSDFCYRGFLRDHL